MSDKQFSIGVKISIAVAIVLLIIMGILAITTLRKKDNSSSILEDVSNSDNVISEAASEELKQYLGVYGILVQEENPTITQNIETVMSFLNTIFWYEPITVGENSMLGYDKDISQNVALELLGNKELPTSEELILDNENNVYRYVDGGEFIGGECVEIEHITQKNNVYEIKYKCVFPSDTEAYEIAEGQEVKLNTYNINIKLEENEEYSYSKYCLKDIELISKDIVKYN